MRHPTTFNSTVFLQFCAEWKQERDIMGPDCHILYNGLSEVWDVCRQMGDFVWMDQDEKKYIPSGAEIRDKLLSTQPPIKKGTIYVSACGNWTQLYQAYLWATQYPEINFIVGGGNVFEKLMWNSDSLPTNLHIESRTANEYFGKKPLTHWHLAFSPTQKMKTLQFGYRVGSGCYWGKCRYCMSKGKCTKRDRLDYEFKNLWPGKTKSIYLCSASIPPDQLKTLIETLPAQEDFYYYGYIRGTRAETKAIKEALENSDIDPAHLRWRIGVELPSARMYKLLNRGMDVKELFESLWTLDELGMTVVQQYLWGWNNLVDEDIRELEYFVDSARQDHAWFKLNRLHGYTSMPWFDRYDKARERTFGPFTMGFPTKVEGDQYERNVIIKKILVETGRFIQAGGNL